ncbi:MAG: glycerol-3-phosphate dehydrogenase [Rhodospirillales bacterium]|nr:glycerol-3-phosphate dehydrogenase [Rhodospirillales bacterium]
MREGSLEAPVRHPLDWRNPDFYDPAKIDAELRRVFEICHGCRRCFNLCDSFPRLFDLIDAAGDAEVAGVRSEDFAGVVDACTLCDMCFMTKCPYVPPHEFNLDFPHLMLRVRAAELRAGKGGFVDRQLTETDRNGRLAAKVAGLANWATETGNRVTRPILEKVARIHRQAPLPRYHGRTFAVQSQAKPPARDATAPARDRKAVLYATCFANYNAPGIGLAARAVLARNGVATEVVYPQCCGMPQLERGDIPRVAAAAEKVAAELGRWIADGYDVVTLVSSCALMMKFEWPLILPENQAVKTLSENTYDIAEYVVDIARKEGLADGMRPLGGGITVHLACHARAQNVGAKGAELLRLIPDAEVAVVERCSGHGGSWGIRTENYEVAHRVGKAAVRQIARQQKPYLVSECPLAAMHLVDGLGRIDGERPAVAHAYHPIELVALAYGM